MHRLTLVLSFLLATLPAMPALAVSLGDEFILSRLGDPVEIEIPLQQWDELELSRVQIVAASAREYAAFDLNWHPVLEQLSFNLLGPDLDGEVKVLVSSREPFNEPYLELLLVLRWPGGSLLREYVLLFDPPDGLMTSAAVAALPEQEPQSLAEPPASEQLTNPESDLESIAAETFVEISVEAPAVEPAATIMAEPLIPASVPAGIAAGTLAEPREPLAPVPFSEAAPESQLSAADQAQAQAQPVAAAETSIIASLGSAAPQTAVARGLAPAPLASTAPGRIVPETTTDTAPEPALPTLERRNYRVRAGDTLWGIASQFRPVGGAVNQYQMLLGLHDLNPGAFVNGNITLLRANGTLVLPAGTDLALLPAATAQTRFEQRWEEGLRRVAAARRGETLPPFAVLDRPTEEVVEQPLEAEVQRPPGQELASAREPEVLTTVPANVVLPGFPEVEGAPAAPLGPEPDASTPAEASPVVVEVARSEPESASPSVIAEQSVSGRLGEPTVADTEPALTQDLPGQVDAQQLARQRRVEELQQQLLVLRQRAEAARVQPAAAVAIPEPPLATAPGNSVTLLGLLTLTLALGLAAALTLLLRIVSQQQRQLSLEPLGAQSPASIPEASSVQSPPIAAAEPPGLIRQEPDAVPPSEPPPRRETEGDFWLYADVEEVLLTEEAPAYGAQRSSPTANKEQPAEPVPGAS